VFGEFGERGGCYAPKLVLLGRGRTVGGISKARRCQMAHWQIEGGVLKCHAGLGAQNRGEAGAQLPGKLLSDMKTDSQNRES